MCQIICKTTVCHLEHLDSLGERHANRLKGGVGCIFYVHL